MKYLITENRVKELIKKYFNLDLTGKIHMVTNKWELPFEFDNFMSEAQLNRSLNKYGPMYIIQTDNRIIGKSNLFLCQNRDKGWEVVDSDDNVYSEFELMKELRIHPLALSIDDLINAYFKD